MKEAWKPRGKSYAEALNYMKKRAKGEAPSIATPWPKFNDALLDGIEWNTLNVIAGRPGTGKTAIKDQIVSNMFDLNPNMDARVLEFSFEMLDRSSVLREFSAVTKKSYKELCSANNSTISNSTFQKCLNHARQKKDIPIDVINTPMTIDEMRYQLASYMEKYKKPTLVTLDHTLLVKSPGKSKTEMLGELGEFFTETKKMYPITYVVLSQLNRNIEHPDRVINGKYGNYILESDVFGSDHILQHADSLIGVNRPGKYKIRFYGPDRYIIADDNVLVLHWLKVRNGDLRMSFFKAVYEEMRIDEMQTPPRDIRTTI